jgi:hypothetical protein
LLAALLLLGAGASSAQAIQVTDERTVDAAFAGDRCGSVDLVDVRAPLGASRVRPVSPAVNERITDDTTGEDAALVFKATPVRLSSRRRAVRYAAVGSNDVCLRPAFYPGGWTASTGFTIRYRINARVLFPALCVQRLRARPRNVVVACGDGNFQLRGMRWRGWHRRSTVGRGTGLANDCTPYCAVGRFHRRPIKVRLSRVRYCSNIARYVYTRLTYRWTRGAPPGGRRSRGSSPFPCSLYDIPDF